MKSTSDLYQLLSLAAAVVVFSQLHQASQAGTIYTTRSSYDAAVHGYRQNWSEDFEDFRLGAAPVPTIIGGGEAEISRPGTARILPPESPQPLSSGKSWLGVEGGVGETIRGPGGASLNVQAIGFDYFSELVGSFNFHHRGGVDTSTSTPSLTPLFVGWVGGAGEVLDSIDYTPSTSAHVLDSFVAHSVPEPVACGWLLTFVACRGRRAPRREPGPAREG